MGLIKSIFGAIFGLLGGIFKTVSGLVGLGKKSEFFMELDESDSSTQPAAALPASAESGAAPAKAASKTPAKASAKAATKAPAKAAPAPAPVVTAPAQPVPTAFASTYLTTVGTSMPRRRRPGPSLSPFLDMAKQVKAR
jgi:predicted lipid-binding transport protein (Tim44 family)